MLNPFTPKYRIKTHEAAVINSETAHLEMIVRYKVERGRLFSEWRVYGVYDSLAIAIAVVNALKTNPAAIIWHK